MLINQNLDYMYNTVVYPYASIAMESGDVFTSEEDEENKVLLAM